MAGPQNAARRAAKDLWPLERARTRAFQLSNELVRKASACIRALHRGDPPAWKELEAAAAPLRPLLQEHPFLLTHGAIQQAWGEYVEALLLDAALLGARLPNHHELDVPAAGYLLGMADLIGELRRATLDRVIAGHEAKAEKALDQMESLFDALTDADAPEGIVALRHKMDVARGLLERTRGELVTAKRTKQLEKKIEGVGRLLDEAEAGRSKKRPQKPSEDLDLDGAWNRS